MSSGRQDDAYLITKWQQEEFAPGQLGAIRVGVDRRNRQQLEGRPRLYPGVYGIVEVRSFPEKRADSPDGFWLDIARVPRYYVCMVRSFNNSATEDVFKDVNLKAARNLCPQILWKVATRKLDQLDSAEFLGGLRIPPSNRLEALKGDRRGQHSIRINEQYRICFIWTETGPRDVEIVDYH